MFIKEINDFFLQQFPLKHVFDGEFFRILDFGDDLFHFLWFEDGVGFDDGDGEGEVDLFMIEEWLIHGSYI